MGFQIDGAFVDGPIVAAELDRLSWRARRRIFGRTGLAHLVDRERGTRIGVEAGLQSDPRYTAASVGVLAATKLGPDLEGQISFGASDQKGRRTKPYATGG